MFCLQKVNVSSPYYAYGDILWHFKNGVWIDRGGLPGGFVHQVGSHPFIANLSASRWGLKAGRHLIYICNPDSNSIQILRFRHLGQRIADGQPGYETPDYLDSNWEILHEQTGTYWVINRETSGQAYYDDDFGIMISYESQMGSTRAANSYKYWDGGSIVELQKADEGDDPVHGSVIILDAPVQAMIASIYPHSTYIEGRIVFFNPSFSNWWAYANGLTDPGFNWHLGDPSIGDTFGTSQWNYQTNFCFFCTKFNIDMDVELGLQAFIMPANEWFDMEATAVDFEIGRLDSSEFDWTWHAVCAGSIYNSTGFIRRKSDNSIHQFHIYTSSLGLNQDLFDIAPLPSNPSSEDLTNKKYTRKINNGPPISGEWYHLRVLNS